jgi:N-acetylneuraminate synthase
MKVLVIAEVGSVHDGSFGNANHLIDTAAECGADAVKFQTHIAEAETLHDAPMPPYFKGEPRFEYFKRTGFTREQWIELKAHAESKGLIFLSSPFSIEAAELLESIGITQHKIPSGEVTNLPMLEVIARTGKPMLLSSGMSSWQALDRAVEVIRKHHDRLTVLQCTTEYPCPYEQVGLNVMLEMKGRYGLPVGLSDHTLTPYAVFAAVTLGASVIEKHLTLSRRMYGSDAQHSLEPSEFADMVRGIRAIETMLKNPVNKNAIERFQVMKETFEKSLVSLVDIPAGATLTRQMIGIKKPGMGLPARRLEDILGRRTMRAIAADQVIQGQDIDWG